MFSIISLVLSKTFQDTYSFRHKGNGIVLSICFSGPQNLFFWASKFVFLALKTPLKISKILLFLGYIVERAILSFSNIKSGSKRKIWLL